MDYKKIYFQVKSKRNECDCTLVRIDGLTEDFPDDQDLKQAELNLLNYYDKLCQLEDKLFRKLINVPKDVEVVNLSKFEPSNDIGGWEIPK